MPNWCSNRIQIKHSDKEKIKELYDNIVEWSSSNYVINGFDGTSWLGNVVGNSGIDRCDDKTEFKIMCRGMLEDLNYTNDTIYITTETAWGPMLKMWQLIVDKYLPEADIIFVSEESGCGLYATNDQYLVDKYILDFYDEIDGKWYESNWEASEKTAIETLQEVLNTTVDNLDELLDMLDEQEIEGLAVHQWQESVIDDFE